MIISDCAFENHMILRSLCSSLSFASLKAVSAALLRSSTGAFLSHGEFKDLSTYCKKPMIRMDYKPNVDGGIKEECSCLFVCFLIPDKAGDTWDT